MGWDKKCTVEVRIPTAHLHEGKSPCTREVRVWKGRGWEGT